MKKMQTKITLKKKQQIVKEHNRGRTNRTIAKAHGIPEENVQKIIDVAQEVERRHK